MNGRNLLRRGVAHVARQIVGAPGSRLRLSETATPCVLCGNRSGYVATVRATPDFDPELLPPEIGRDFFEKDNGFCSVCGFYQDFRRPAPEHIRTINRIGKDQLSRQRGFDDPLSNQAFVAEFNARYFARRTAKWRHYFSERAGKRLERALFLRAWFGAAPAFADEHFGIQKAVAVDISDGCLSYLNAHFPTIELVDGEISGLLEGAFLEEGAYNAVFVFHCLNHAAKPVDYVRRLASCLAPGGFVVFSNEIERKVLNPFHLNHADERQLISILRSAFGRIDRVNDCQEGSYPYVTEYTVKHDVPDFVCYR